MEKNLAILLVNHATKSRLNNENTIFSNINAAIDVWWLEPNNYKFATELNFVLYHPTNNCFFHFMLPAGTISNPRATFEQRNDKDYSKIYIPISTNQFEDRRGFNFTPFLVAEVRL
jgi:hypothetical protein